MTFKLTFENDSLFHEEATIVFDLNHLHSPLIFCSFQSHDDREQQ